MRVYKYCILLQCSDEKFRAHFSKIAEVTDACLKFNKEGKFRQFGFIGYKTEADAEKAIKYFNNTFMDASKMVVEACAPLNSADKQRAWSKYSKDSSAFQKTHPEVKVPVVKNAKERKKELNELRKKLKEEKLESLIGDLKDDAEFKEFLQANKAIKSNDNLWHNDIHLEAGVSEQVEDSANEPKENVNKETGSGAEKPKSKKSEKAESESKIIFGFICSCGQLQTK
jgi:multiple RNA-binding domain-containing protein 1